MIRLLTFSSLFPSSVRPSHGIFVETRLRELLATGEVEAKVVAPVPWFFSTDEAKWGDRARIASTPARETRNGIDVLHPRYALLPKVGMTLAPLGMAFGVMPAVQRLIDEGFEFDAIDAHYFYPDGVAAAIVARRFGKPFTITARGSDLNLISKFALPRRMMQWAAARAAACIGVSAALVDVMRSLGFAAGRLHMMRNGVDLQRFRPLDRDQARRELGLAGAPLLLSVGNLVELKGHVFLIEALARLLPSHGQAQLVIVGEGPERGRLLARARELGVADRVMLAGSRPNTELFKWYSAADVSLLASSREGWANVLLESMACGTPVVATAVGGSPEIVSDAAGLLVQERSGEAFAAAIAQLLAQPPARERVRRYAEDFDWRATSAAQLALFSSLVESRAKEFVHA
ncbi:glycosyltransferase [Pelomonas sp. KK5]|uniref:glycosyltransferase n=1 Tax=Pelomonas sp. KK5 TaxID=1855730 RepID=UPI00117D19BE